MSQKIKIGIIIFFAIIFQVSFFPSLTSGKMIPDIVLVLIILWSFKRSFEDIWSGVFFSGIILDLVVFGKIGINAISFICISFIASFLQERFFISQRRGSFFIIVIIVIGGTILNALIVDFLADFYINILSNWLIMKIVGNIVVSIFLYAIMLRFQEFFGIRERKLVTK